VNTYHEEGYNADDMENIFTAARRILRTSTYDRPLQWCAARGRMILGDVVVTREAREWHLREQQRYELHPAVRKAMRMSRPKDWQQLLLEWPHQSTTDKGRVAYTQNERKGESDTQTVTSLGKYLRAHFVNLPDHAIRDIVALHSTNGCKFVHTIAEMIYHIERGPYSCMQKAGYGVDRHPYRAYDPRLGWHLAVLEEGGDTVSRALCNTDVDGQKYFVRTYAKQDGGGTRTCERMQAWLKDQGYEHRSGWGVGTHMAFVEERNDCGFVAPYIDGDCQHVNVTTYNGVQVLSIDDDGEYECCRQDGDADDQSGSVCSSCSERYDEDDGLWVGYNESEMVCQSCGDEYYTCGYGRGGRQYYFSRDDSVYCEHDDNTYHQDYLDDNGMVWDVDGNVVPESETCEIDGDYYLTDDKRVVCLENGTYGLKEDCWQCTESGEWYSAGVDYVEIDGDKYYPDNAPEQDEDTDETSDNV
jgi:hypothetical protein